jgi:2,5-diketo-D-gluconate reductase A
MTRADSVNELVERGREAAARGLWREAYDLLAAVEPAELSPEDLELIGVARDRENPAVSEERLVSSESVELASGTSLPVLGLGTWQARGRSAVNAVLRALEVGYRHFDTATAYGNEKQVGQAIAESGVARDAIFVTTKLPPGRAGRERATLEESLDALGFGYVDLWLIHWPPGGEARPDVWAALLELQGEGLAREVGVSNYSVRQIDELAQATGRMPAVNQIEWSPALFDRGILEAHRSRGVQLEGYSPLKTMSLQDARLVRIAEKHGVTPAQVILRWHIEHRIVAIPKSTNSERIDENAAIFGFELTPAEMDELDTFSSTRLE